MMEDYIVHFGFLVQNLLFNKK